MGKRQVLAIFAVFGICVFALWIYQKWNQAKLLKYFGLKQSDYTEKIVINNPEILETPLGLVIQDKKCSCQT